MEYSDYLRDQAEMYRQQADATDDPAVRQDLLECAEVCDEVACEVEDARLGG
jgi:hypothetical protein